MAPLKLPCGCRRLNFFLRVALIPHARNEKVGFGPKFCRHVWQADTRSLIESKDVDSFWDLSTHADRRKASRRT